MATGAEAEPPDLRAHVEIPCTLCGNPQHRTIVPSRELEAQHRYLRLFHRRRLRTRGKDALEERADFTQDYATNIVACTGCGLVFRDPRPSGNAVTRAYESDTYGADRLGALFESQLELFRPKARVLGRLIGKPDPVVLEIGSFVGGFLAASAELGWHATGIDPGTEVAEFCRSKGLTVLAESVENCEPPRGSVDGVVIWNTFDQLPDPHPALRLARRCLREGGLLVVRVPNGQCFEGCMLRLRRWPSPLRRVLLAAMAWNNLLSFPYLHGYALTTLDRLVDPYGFHRVHERGDVLTRLADGQTRSWAAAEERLLKTGWKAYVAAASAISVHSVEAAPWLDVYYRAAGKH